MASTREPIFPAVETVKGQTGDLVDNAVRENIKRAVEQLKTADPISMKILEEVFDDGDDIVVDTNGTSDKFVFNKTSTNQNKDELIEG